jgi:hypothetical protein
MSDGRRVRELRVNANNETEAQRMAAHRQQAAFGSRAFWVVKSCERYTLPAKDRGGLHRALDCVLDRKSTKDSTEEFEVDRLGRELAKMLPSNEKCREINQRVVYGKKYTKREEIIAGAYRALNSGGSVRVYKSFIEELRRNPTKDEKGG